jgi:sodium-dependent dicarboxylate transporter 2/3/5
VSGGRISWTRRLKLLSGPLLATLVYLLVPRELRDASGEVVATLSENGRVAMSVTVLMTAWWLTEAIPLEAAGLLPLVLLPALGVMDLKHVAPSYADPVIFLFLGGMLLGAALERWGLHRRVGYTAVAWLGRSPSMLVGSILAASAFLSMWVSNTATAVMMLPIAASVVLIVSEEAGAGREQQVRNLGLCAVLAVAYGASIGGVGTLIGTPPTAYLAGFVRERYGQTLTFAEWMVVGVPIVILTGLVAWALLTRFIYPIEGLSLGAARAKFAEHRRALGPLSAPEWRVLGVFVLTATAWVVVPLLMRNPDVKSALSWGSGADAGVRVSDAAIGLAGGLLLFLIPTGSDQARSLLTWEEAARVPWGVLLLFGGGLAMADTIDKTGIDDYLAGLGGFMAGWPVWVVVLVVALSATFLSEVTSNTAQTAVMLPVGAALAERLGVPAAVVVLPGVLGACLAFMLPAGTPPNAIVFASGRITIRQMAWAGLWLNFACGGVVACFVLFMMKMGWMPGGSW